MVNKRDSWYNRAMNTRPTSDNSASQRRNFADYINAGFGVFLRRPWLIIVLISWDAWLWLDARWSLQTWIQAIRRGVEQAQTRWTRLFAFDQTMLDQMDARTSTTLFHHVPTLFSARVPATLNRSVWETNNGWLTLGLVGAINIGALLMSTLVLQTIGDTIAQRRWSWQRFGRNIWALFRLDLVIFIGCAMFALPALACAALFASVSSFVSQVIITSVLFMLLVVWLYTGLSASAICVGNVSPLIAIYQSYNVVRQHFRTASVLILATIVITQGMTVLIRPIASSLGSMIAASALVAIATCTSAASKAMFYHEKVTTLAQQYPAVGNRKQEVVRFRD